MSSSQAENKIHVGAYGFCMDPDGRLLLARVSEEYIDGGAWTLPGGGVQWGEHPDQAVLREMEEETGLFDLKIRSIIRIYSHIYPNNAEIPMPPVHHVGIVYKLETGSYQLRNETDGTTDLCQWLDETQVRNLSLTPLGEFGVHVAWPAGSP